jgi:hypothetical protein
MLAKNSFSFLKLYSGAVTTPMGASACKARHDTFQPSYQPGHERPPQLAASRADVRASDEHRYLTRPGPPQHVSFRASVGRQPSGLTCPMP